MFFYNSQNSTNNKLSNIVKLTFLIFEFNSYDYEKYQYYNL